MRAAQSKGIVDLLAVWFADEPTDIDGPRGTYLVRPPWFIQAKYSIHGAGRLPSHEAIELVALAEATGGVPVYARQGENGRGVEFINLVTKESLV